MNVAASVRYDCYLWHWFHYHLREEALQRRQGINEVMVSQNQIPVLHSNSSRSKRRVKLIYSTSSSALKNISFIWAEPVRQINFRDLKVKSNCVNRVARAPGVILEGASEKCLWGEQSTNPENRRRTTGDPSLQETDPLKKIWNPGTQWFQRQVGLFRESIKVMY